MRKILSVLVSFAVIFAMIPSMAFAEVTGPTIKLDKTSTTYTGDVVGLTATVKNGDATLTEKTDYELSYSKKSGESYVDIEKTDIKDAGEYKVTASGGSGAEAWTAETSFTINKLNPSDITATIDPQSVGASTSGLSISFKNGSTDLHLASSEYSAVPEADTVVLGSKNNVKVTFTGSNFTADKTVNVVFAGKYDLSNYSISVKTPASSTVEYSYGKKYTAAFTFEKNSGAPATLPDTPTYAVTYTNNEDVTDSEIIATLTGTGDFKGTVEKHTGVTIVRRSITNCKYKLETSTSETEAPEATVTDGSYTLVPDKDYTIRVTDSTNKTAEIIGQGNYKDSIPDLKFTVGTEITSVTLSSSTFAYNGSSQKPSVTVKAGEVTVPSTGYRIDWPADTTSVGTKTFTVVGVGAYAGQINKTYTITQKYIDKLDITMSGTSFKETGLYIKPTITVRDGYTTLKENTDYVLSYSNNVSASYSPALCTVSMIGNYYGSKTLEYYIGKTSASALTVTLDKSSYNYTGSKIEPVVTVKNGTTTVSSSNYTVDYKNNKAVGTGTVELTFKYGYYGTITKTFTIEGKTVANCTVTLSATKYAADGTEKKPSVTVKDGTKTLVNGTDYTVSYANNVTPGTASVTITGKNGYSGTQTVNFTITGLYQYVDVEQDEYTKYPTSSPFKITASCNGDGTGFTYVSSNPSVATVSSDGTVTLKAPGKVVITVATKGDKKYTPASAAVTITVKPNKGAISKLGTPAKKSIRVYITKRTGVDGYQVRYSRGTGYKYFTTKHVNSSYKTQYRTIRNLKSGYKYKVQVRAYKILDDGTKVYGSWSTAKTITVK